MFKINISNLIGIASFGVFSFLAALQVKGSNINKSLLIIAIGIGIGILTIFLLEFASKSICKKQNSSKENILKGQEESKSYIYMLPFTIMALTAYFILGWNTVQPFFSAAVMAASTASGATNISLGGKRIVSMLVPAAISLLSITIFSVVVNVIGGVI